MLYVAYSETTKWYGRGAVGCSQRWPYRPRISTRTVELPSFGEQKVGSRFLDCWIIALMVYQEDRCTIHTFTSHRNVFRPRFLFGNVCCSFSNDCHAVYTFWLAAFCLYSSVDCHLYAFSVSITGYLTCLYAYIQRTSVPAIRLLSLANQTWESNPKCRLICLPLSRPNAHEEFVRRNVFIVVLNKISCPRFCELSLWSKCRIHLCSSGLTFRCVQILFCYNLREMSNIKF